MHLTVLKMLNPFTKNKLFHFILYFGISLCYQSANISSSGYENTVLPSYKLPSYESCNNQSKFKFIKDLEIKSDEKNTNQSFLYPGGIEVDSKGNIYVLEPTEYRVQVYDKKGQYVKSIGRKGQGPGEFEVPHLIFIDKEDKLYIYDLMRRTIILFDKEGKFLKNILINSQILIVKKITIDSKFNIICGYFPPFWSESNRYLISKFNKDFIHLTEIFRKNGIVPYIKIKGVSFYPPPYTPTVIWTMDKDDNLFVNYNKNYEIEVLSRDGKLINKITKKYKSEKITDEERQEIKESYGKRAKQFIESIKIPKVKLPLSSFHLVENYLFVQKRRVDRKYFFDVFEKNGKYINEITLNFRPLLNKDGFVYTIKADVDWETRDIKNVRIIRYKLEISNS